MRDATFLSPAYARDHVDIDTYFFFEKIFRSGIRICVLVTTFYDILPKGDITKKTNILIPDRNIFQKKIYVSIST